ncbi:MAG: hypothetical protein WBF53_16765 [Litorimonas sp.]
MTFKTLTLSLLAGATLSACASTPDNPFKDPVGERMVELAEDYEAGEKRAREGVKDLREAEDRFAKARKSRDRARDRLRDADRDLERALEAQEADRMLTANTGGVSPDLKRTERLAKHVREARKDVEDARDDIRKAERSMDRARDAQDKAKDRIKSGRERMDEATRDYRRGT